MQEDGSAKRKAWLIRAGILGAVVLVAGALALRGVDFRSLITRAMAFIGSAGPWAFFGAMAVLPAVGFPILGFAIPAGPAFADRLGVPGVLSAYGAALAANLALTYWMARYAIRPFAERALMRAGYRVPRFEPSEQLEVSLLVRITPGPPFFIQSYLLGLGGVAFLTYMWVSWVISMCYGVSIIVFGEAILHGRAGRAGFGVCLLIAAVLVVHLLRRHYGKKRGQPGR